MKSTIYIEFNSFSRYLYYYRHSKNPIYKQFMLLKVKYYKYRLFKRFKQDKFSPDDVFQFLSIMIFPSEMKEEKWVYKPFTLITDISNYGNEIITAFISPVEEDKIKYKTKINIKLHNCHATHIKICIYNYKDELISLYSLTSFHKDSYLMRTILKYTIKAINELFDKWLVEDY